MIRIKPHLETIEMEIKLTLPQIDVINFLQKKGYEVKAFTLVLPATEEMLLSEPRTEIHTFTATKQDERDRKSTRLNSSH